MYEDKEPETKEFCPEFATSPVREIFINYAIKRLEELGQELDPLVVEFTARKLWLWATTSPGPGIPSYRLKPGPPTETLAPDRIWFDTWGPKPK